jgi:hypothetical protein
MHISSPRKSAALECVVRLEVAAFVTLLSRLPAPLSSLRLWLQTISLTFFPCLHLGGFPAVSTLGFHLCLGLPWCCHPTSIFLFALGGSCICHSQLDPVIRFILYH